MRRRNISVEPRRDIVPIDDAKVSEALAAAYHGEHLLVSAEKRAAAPAAETERDLGLRVDLIEPRRADPNGFERVIGESDLTSINYLRRGTRAAAAVCRIRVPGEGGEWYGTGFLVGPRLLMTNHHVLANAGEASQAEAEFGYEHDVDGVLQPPIQFNLEPTAIFHTDAALDVTFVAVTPYSEGGVPLERFGYLPLLPLSGKSADKEWVTIIQHPGGEPKQISIRSSQIALLPEGVVSKATLENFIHYLTDTEPGSSGSPVVNDQWQVIALHHKAVPAPRDMDKPDEPIIWIGNEGVRVSAIYRMLERRRLEDPMAARILDRLEGALGFAPMSQMTSVTERDDNFEGDGKPYKKSRWSSSTGIGYDPNFLSQTIDLQTVYAAAERAGDVAPLLDGSGEELKYHRFSVVVHKRRKFALVTASNIDGGKFHHPGDRQSTWRQDERMAPEYQPDGAFYEKKRGTDKIQFSRGHLVRRFDPSWGESVADAKLGDQDTFHYTNAAPQFQTYNDADWGDLEDYVLRRAEITEQRMSVFQGPIYRDDDPLFGKSRVGGPWQIPLSFWKIAVLQKGEDQIAAAAFIVGQMQYVRALYEAKVFSGLNPYTVEEMRERKIQTTVEEVERITGLDFSAIRRFDAHGSLESTRQTRFISRLDDILI